MLITESDQPRLETVVEIEMVPMLTSGSCAVATGDGVSLDIILSTPLADQNLQLYNYETIQRFFIPSISSSERSTRFHLA